MYIFNKVQKSDEVMVDMLDDMVDIDMLDDYCEQFFKCHIF